MTTRKDDDDKNMSGFAFRDEFAAQNLVEKKPQTIAKPEPEANTKPEQTSGEILDFRPKPAEEFLDRSVDLETLRIPLTRFPAVNRTIPDAELVCDGWQGLIAEIAPDPAPVITEKKHVPYYIAGTLKDAEFVGRTRERALERGRSTFGKQRSSKHIASLGPALLLDDDGNVLAREARLGALGAAAVLYTSHSYGFVKEGEKEPSQGGRTVLVGNRQWTPDEHPLLWDGIEHLLGGGFDEHGRSAALCYGRHARRSEDAPHECAVIEGAAFDVDAVIALGRTLRPQYNDTRIQTKQGRKRAWAEELERVKLMGAVRPLNDYGEWMSSAAACKRAFPDNEEAAFELFDTLSACSPAEIYKDADAARKKFDEVPIEYDGEAAPVTLDMLHWRTKRRAEKVIRLVYSPLAGQKVAQAFADQPTVILGGGPDGPCPKGDEPIPPGSLKPEDGRAALEYLLFCWSEKAYQHAIEGRQIPQYVLEEVQQRAEERRERIDLNGRTLHIWSGKDLSADTANLANAIIDAEQIFFKIDHVLVRVSDPTADPTHAARLRRIHNYNGLPGGEGDPVKGGKRLTPVLHSDTEAVRAIIAEHIATKIAIQIGKGNKATIKNVIGSFAFKSNTDIRQGPDGPTLRDLCKRALPERASEVAGIVTAPIMSRLPASTKPEDLLREDADYIVTEPGFDVASGMYFAPIGTPVAVPAEPTQGQLRDAVELLKLPFLEFTFAAPAENLPAKASHSVVIYGAMVAANRRALPTAPGFALTSHGEGMSQGKTLIGGVLVAITTGVQPTVAGLSSDFNEQEKQIISYIVEGLGDLFLDEIPSNTRFDSATLAKIMTSRKFRGRLLGVTKKVDVSTQVLVVATGCSLNMAGALASRFLLANIDTGLERPQDRSSANFKIPKLIDWTVAHRQEIVAAVHTIVRAYLQECRRQGGTPSGVVARRGEIKGTRSEGECEILRDAFLWAFPELPDPFLGFIASTAASSTREDKAHLLHLIDRYMVIEAGKKLSPTWAIEPVILDGDKMPDVFWRWQKKLRDRLPPDERERRYAAARKAYPADTSCDAAIQDEQRRWHRIQTAVQIRRGRPEVRSGRIKFSSKEILQMGAKNEELAAALQAVLPKNHTLNPFSVGRWLKNQLVNAPIDGLVMRKKEKVKTLYFWIASTPQQ